MSGGSRFCRNLCIAHDDYYLRYELFEDTLVLQGDADEDGDNRISEQEFVNVLQKPQARQCMAHAVT